ARHRARRHRRDRRRELAAQDAADRGGHRAADRGADRVKALAALAALCSCGGSGGTIQVSLVTAPDSHLLDAVQKLRVTLTQPRQVVVADRSGSGFDLALEFDAVTDSGALIVEGFDASGRLVACGQSPKFPVAGVSARVAVYLAAPISIALAPVALGGARSQ